MFFIRNIFGASSLYSQSLTSPPNHPFHYISKTKSSEFLKVMFRVYYFSGKFVRFLKNFDCFRFYWNILLELSPNCYISYKSKFLSSIECSLQILPKTQFFQKCVIWRDKNRWSCWIEYPILLRLPIYLMPPFFPPTPQFYAVDHIKYQIRSSMLSSLLY